MAFDPNLVKALLIDLDGTLLDTIVDLAAAANAVRVEFGHAALAIDRIQSFVGKGADKLVHRALTDDFDGRLQDSDFRSARSAFDRHYQRENGRQATIYPGVLEGLERFKQRGLAMACVTNKPQAFSDDLLRKSGLSDYFSFVIGGDALAERKPHPAPLHHAAARLGVDASSCLMIGDSINDALAARAANMPVLIVPYGYNEGRPARSIDSDGIVDSFIAIDTLLG